ncbi:MAG TPA: sterol desaturase family protein [Alphaproteobacteria bacterium]|nr:sterol desaturase family protein [Alphaproteobacteria bacterium]
MPAEAALRLAVFAAVLALLAAAEAWRPRRRRGLPRRRRWPANLGLAALGVAGARLALPLGAVAWAEVVAARGWGLLPALGLTGAAGAVPAVVLLDLAVWAQHVAFHRFGPLWRLHRAHHSDTDVDVTTGLRFHPLEILLSLGFKCAVIAALGAPPAAVLAFEVLLNAGSMFSHSNLALPPGLDRALRLVCVTPDMHRIHHSPHRAETDSNYGFALPWWDRLFGTYRAEPTGGHEGMALGLERFRAESDQRLRALLLQPWRGGR